MAGGNGPEGPIPRMTVTRIAPPSATTKPAKATPNRSRRLAMAAEAPEAATPTRSAASGPYPLVAYAASEDQLWKES